MIGYGSWGGAHEMDTSLKAERGFNRSKKSTEVTNGKEIQFKD